MRTTYHVVDEGEFAVVTARTAAPLWGRWCILTLSVHQIEHDTAITFGFRGAEPGEVQGEPTEALPDGILRLSESWGSGYRVVEQELVVPRLEAWILELTDLQDGGVDVARILCTSLFRTYESMLETVRQSIHRNIASDLRSRFISALHTRFVNPTRQTVRSLLGDLHWRLLLKATHCDPVCAATIEYTFRHDPLKYNELNEQRPLEIPLLASESTRLDEKGIADRRAMALLRRVCGDAAAEKFRTAGYITVESQGYRFQLAPLRFVRCVDPQGRRADLCIYTAGLQCNPIDELVLAYLSIRYRLAEYLRTANIISSDPGFQRVPA